MTELVPDGTRLDKVALGAASSEVEGSWTALFADSEGAADADDAGGMVMVMVIIADESDAMPLALGPALAEVMTAVGGSRTPEAGTRIGLTEAAPEGEELSDADGMREAEAVADSSSADGEAEAAALFPVLPVLPG